MSVYRYDGNVRNGQGFALSGVDVYVCTQPASTGAIPPSPLATIYSDSAGLVPLTNPVKTDGLGNFFFYAASGAYTLVIYDPNNGIATLVLPDQAVLTPGGGSVTSVDLSMPAEFAVSGNPITGAGTIVVAKNNQNANLVYAGPSGGGAAAPSFRAMVAADLPAAVQAIVAAIAANTVLAGPTSGSPAAPAARQLVAADISGIVATTFSATPTFDASKFACPVFTITLTGNVTSSVVTNPKAGQRITFIITQDGTGSRTFAWPATFHGASNIGSDANSVTVQDFVYDGAYWRAIGPGSVNAS